eukprot:GFYU01004700.1.p1 GENE.GFYU01004700.1~~GFYU01004700.1.p1  ORF type:complete len:217 (+),score=53.12 GFYU01004700.1:80-730(+)
MPKITLIARTHDSLPLTASVEDDTSQDARELDMYKNQAKRIFKQLTPNSPPRCSIESGKYYFHYLVDRGVVYLTLTDKGYPKKLAFNYLEELQREFTNLYSNEIDNASRPYAFIKFDTFIQKTRKLYSDTRAQRNLQKLNDDLNDVHRVMTKSIQDVLGRGEKLDTVSQMSSNLAMESKKYSKQAKYLNTQAFYRKWGPVAVFAVVVLVFFYLRFF